MFALPYYNAQNSQRNTILGSTDLSQDLLGPDDPSHTHLGDEVLIATRTNRILVRACIVIEFIGVPHV